MRKTRTPRYRNWVAVLYTENLKDSWKSSISDVLPCAFAYCVHQPEEENLKEHVHVMMIFNGPVSEVSVKSTVALLDKDVTKPACASKIQRVLNVKSMYDYLIHADTESKLNGKIQYDPSERICGNGFNIEDYDHNTKKSMKNARLRWICNLIIKNQDLTNLRDLLIYLEEHRQHDFDRYMSIVQKNMLMVSKLLECNRDIVSNRVLTVEEMQRRQKTRVEYPIMNETEEVKELLGEE